MRILIAGIVGGLIIFICGAIAHEATGLGTAGLAVMAPEREAAVVDAMKAAMGERKIYFFPGVDLEDPQARKSDAFKAKVAQGPTGIVAYNPGAGCVIGPKMLGTEFAFNVLEGLIAAFIVAHLAANVGYGKRVAIVALIGLAESVSIDGSYWNWYQFPDAYFAAQLAMSVFGSLMAGLAIAKLVRSPS